MNNVGKTFVDRGMWLYKAGDLDAAIRVQRTALEYLHEDDHRNRFAALHILGVGHRELGELEIAMEHAARARELLPHLGPWLAANLSWLDARIAVDRKDYENAEGLLRQTIEAFCPVSAEAAALATAELVRVLLLQGRYEVAHAMAKTLVGYIIPIEDKSPAAAAVVMDLLRCGQAGHGIDLELVERVACALEEAQACPGGHARSGR